MKHIIYFLILFIPLKIYSQTNKINMELIKKEILDNKNTYSVKPYYTVKLQIQACNFELLLNDIPVLSYSVKSGMTNEIPLNPYILKSGKQNLKIKLTPINDQLKLSEQIDLSLDLGYNNIIDENNGLGEYIQSGKFNLSQEIKDKKLPYFEIEIPFNAYVPWDYKNILEDAQDLSKQSDLLKQTVNNFYHILETKDSKKYFELMKGSLKVQSDVEYMSRKEIDKLLNDLDLSQIKKIYPLDNYEIKLYANGKLVRFVSKTKDEDGNQYLFRYTVPPLIEGKRDGEGSFNYLFYLPKDQKELEVF
ncbi:hypothetical protein [[Flexibacter] sp. ATCC 35103]|uniref:hypothetical protein n=1 Tax=[Flexibacter] sp. ATCC 35103 TaxID=1937528 RepID=UPI0009CF4185|nr:hypothetical protein [[Flexibacter] sp. ATCC 35103]OMQ09519.1 hypothetical protein BXU01_18040 [[Flexibacter] sp. ATCC 35103]